MPDELDIEEILADLACYLHHARAREIQMATDLATQQTKLNALEDHLTLLEKNWE